MPSEQAAQAPKKTSKIGQKAGMLALYIGNLP